MIELRLVVAPVGRAKLVGNVVESIAPGTTRWPSSLPVLFGDHDGDVLGEAMDLFEDATATGIRGIGARLFVRSTSENIWRVGAIVQGRYGCSIQYRGAHLEHRVVDGFATRAIVGAELEHVAVVGNPAYGTSMTRAWRADVDACLDDAPWEIQELDRKWCTGVRAAAAQRRRAAERERAAAAATNDLLAAWEPHLTNIATIAAMPREVRAAFVRGMPMPRAAR